jgi:tRNA 2-thiouridine synthesizing protein C
MHTPKKKQLLFSLRHAPYGNSLAKEALDAILATSAYDQQLSVVFIDDGVFQLMDNQQAEVIEEKSISNRLSAFPLYDITALFVCAESLQQRGLTQANIPNEVTLVDAKELKQLFSQQDHLLSF